jgi:hypothetical protein
MCYWCTVDYAKCYKCLNIYCCFCQKLLGKSGTTDNETAKIYDIIITEHLKTCQPNQNDEVELCLDCSK